MSGVNSYDYLFKLVTASLVPVDPADISRPDAFARCLVDGLVDHFTQKTESGGVHTSPLMRLLLLFLAKSIDAKVIVETGYDAGITTEALAVTGGRVIGIDNLTEYPEADALAVIRLSGYDNVELVQAGALEFLRGQPDGSVCFLFIDDWHDVDHVRREAVEARRIIRPGGIIAFHDTKACHIWQVIVDTFPDWDKMALPAVSVVNDIDYGLGIVRRRPE